MEMTELEIVRSYKEAKYPQEQIKILADINICPQRQIIDILNENGLDVPQMKKGRPRRVRTDDTETRYKVQKQPEPIQVMPDKEKSSEPIPGTIFRIATARMEELDGKLQSLKRQDVEIRDEIRKTEKEYIEIARFLNI